MTQFLSWRSIFRSVALVALTYGSTSLIAAETPLEIRNVVWGFDGTAMRDRFVPLTLVIDNPGREPFDGTVSLVRTDFAGQRIGGLLTETVYLAPATQRKVQFFPLTLSDMDGWKLIWEGGEAKLPTPRFSSPARVLLVEETEMFDRGGAVKRFPERYFPPFVTATDPLSEIVLDHPPEWEAPQRNAFLEWLSQGGKVHLLNSGGGTDPRFTGDLAILNEPSREFQIGSGLVRRHSVQRSGLTANYVRQQLDTPPRPIEETPEDVERLNQGYQVYTYPLDQWRMASGTFNQLKQMMSVQHNWTVIHLLSLSYVAVLFPGCFLIGREFRSVSATFGTMVGSTLLFGAAFYLVGNRGYGESTNVHSVALAEHIEGNRYDATVWSSVFVIAGGDYVFSHPGTARLYSDATENEIVGGVMTSGATGSFKADVPPYSTRIMAHKAVVQVPRTGPPKWESSASNGAPSFTLPADFPTETWQAFALVDREVFTLSRSGNSFRPVGAAKPVRDFLQIKDAELMASAASWQAEQTPTDKRLTQLINPLMLYSLRLTTDDELKAFYLPPDKIKLFIYGPLTTPFHVLSNTTAIDNESSTPQPLPSQSGGVLYSFEVTI